MTSSESWAESGQQGRPQTTQRQVSNPYHPGVHSVLGSDHTSHVALKAAQDAYGQHSGVASSVSSSSAQAMWAAQILNGAVPAAVPGAQVPVPSGLPLDADRPTQELYWFLWIADQVIKNNGGGDYARRSQLCAQIERLFKRCMGKKLFPKKARLLSYGSYPVKMFLPWASDLDFVVTGLGLTAEEQASGAASQNPIQVLRTLAAQISAEEWAEGKPEMVEQAKIPLFEINCRTISGQGTDETSVSSLFDEPIKCQFSVENVAHTGLKTLDYIQNLADHSLPNVLRPLVLILKQMLWYSDLNTHIRGGLSSYLITLLVTAFVQQFHKKTVDREEVSRAIYLWQTAPTLSRILLDFLRWFGSIEEDRPAESSSILQIVWPACPDEGIMEERTFTSFDSMLMVVDVEPLVRLSCGKVVPYSHFIAGNDTNSENHPELVEEPNFFRRRGAKPYAETDNLLEGLGLTVVDPLDRKTNLGALTLTWEPVKAAFRKMYHQLRSGRFVWDTVLASFRVPAATNVKILMNYYSQFPPDQIIPEADRKVRELRQVEETEATLPPVTLPIPVRWAPAQYTVSAMAPPLEPPRNQDSSGICFQPIQPGMPLVLMMRNGVVHHYPTSIYALPTEHSSDMKVAMAMQQRRNAGLRWNPSPTLNARSYSGQPHQSQQAPRVRYTSRNPRPTGSATPVGTGETAPPSPALFPQSSRQSLGDRARAMLQNRPAGRLHSRRESAPASAEREGHSSSTE